ncbi:MAG: type III secretion protein [Planctomycetota bacterium]|jgi:hypothetical protein|nr:type III secretion protein [Planctomycetota bacterium]
MAGYPLAPLFSTYVLREDRAERQTRQARASLAAAEQERNKATAELERYRLWRPGEAERLFSAIRGRHLEQDELAEYHQSLAVLTQGEIERQDAVGKAENAVQAAEAALLAAREAQIAAARERQKIAEHRENWNREEALRLERVEEAEAEDFPYHRETLEEGEDGDSLA